MTRRDFGLLVLLAAIWGASFLFIRVAVPVFGPYVMVEIRVLLAGVCLVGFQLSQRHSLHPVVPWPRYVLLGLLSAGAPFVMIGASELTLPVATAAILNATTPMFTALGAAFFLQDRLTLRKLSGVLLGIIGVAVLAGFRPDAAADIPAVLLSLGGAVFYAAGGIYAKSAFPDVPAPTLATYQQFGAAIVVLPFALAVPYHAELTTAAVVALLLLSIVSTAFAYLIYYRLLTEGGPTRALSVTFLVPAFGMLWGWMFLGERIGVASVGGLATILLSVFLVTELRLGARTGAPESASAPD